MFDKSLTNQAKYFRNFMKVFELLLLFARATRQQLWELHLSTLHQLTKYFFAYDMFNQHEWPQCVCPKCTDVKRKTVRHGSFS